MYLYRESTPTKMDVGRVRGSLLNVLGEIFEIIRVQI